MPHGEHEKRGQSVRTPGCVKGTSRRVVIVRPPDREVFEEAIFIVREDYLSSPGVSRSRLLEEAGEAAAEYTERTAGGRRRRSFPPALWAAAGAGLSAALYLILRMAEVV